MKEQAKIRFTPLDDEGNPVDPPDWVIASGYSASGYSTITAPTTLTSTGTIYSTCILSNTGNTNTTGINYWNYYGVGVGAYTENCRYLGDAARDGNPMPLMHELSNWFRSITVKQIEPERVAYVAANILRAARGESVIPVTSEREEMVLYPVPGKRYGAGPNGQWYKFMGKYVVELREVQEYFYERYENPKNVMITAHSYCEEFFDLFEPYPLGKLKGAKAILEIIRKHHV